MDSQPAEKIIRVYHVEDQVLLRESLHVLLELESDVELVGAAGDAESALAELDSVEADVVLMDIRLPGMDGVEATRLLKQKHPGLPVIILISYKDEFLGPAFEAGASGYILKSCTRSQLVKAMRDARESQTSVDPSLIGGLVQQLADLRRESGAWTPSSRQLDILKLVARGTKQSDIPAALSLSDAAVEREMSEICEGLAVEDPAHAVSEAYRRRILDAANADTGDPIEILPAPPVEAVDVEPVAPVSDTEPASAPGTGRIASHSPEDSEDVPEESPERSLEELFDGRVKLRVPASGSVQQVIKLVAALRERSEFRLLWLEGRYEEEVAILLRLREPLALKKILLEMGGVARVYAFRPREEAGYEHLLTVHLLPPQPTADGSVHADESRAAAEPPVAASPASPR